MYSEDNIATLVLMHSYISLRICFILINSFTSRAARHIERRHPGAWP
jgi:hypothetical protein